VKSTGLSLRELAEQQNGEYNKDLDLIQRENSIDLVARSGSALKNMYFITKNRDSAMSKEDDENN
jgi:hypothetical protein